MSTSNLSPDTIHSVKTSVRISREYRLQLFLLGFLTLFLELALIRFLAGTVWNLGYFPNLVLIAVFLGMGLGFVVHPLWNQKTSQIAFAFAAVILAALVLLVFSLHPALPGFTQWAGQVGGELYFTNTSADLSGTSPLLFVLWFVCIVMIFLLIAQKTAKVFAVFRPLTAYTLDIAGSCAGIVAFMIISFLGLPATVWFVGIAVLFLLAAGKAAATLRTLMSGSLLLILLAVTIHDLGLKPLSSDSLTELHWSPYQKVELLGRRTISVNGIGHQEIKSRGEIEGSFYSSAYRARAAAGLPPYRSVLILGAGAGNDVAAALMHGAEHVDAVEIDPVIAALGRKYHPLHPYDDPRVTLVVDDGRAFMTRTKHSYDLVVFALTDSLVKVSPVSQLRLENYLFTTQSVARASQILTADGDVLFYNFYRRPWIQQKILSMIKEATGRNPKTLEGGDDFAVIVAGSHQAAEPLPQILLPLPTDDWPFLYMEHRRIPLLYLTAMAGVTLVVVLLLVALEAFARTKKRDSASLRHRTAFLCMGVAFLLLETKSVIQFSLLFGTTWLNNSLVFLAILLLVLAANWTVEWLCIRRCSLPGFLLLCSCLLSLFFPLGNLLRVDSVFLRFVLASLLTFLPIFFGNLVFSAAFRSQKFAEHVFGWNLIGATLGGVVEYMSIVLGFSALTWIVLGCYAVTLVLITVDVRRGVRQLWMLWRTQNPRDPWYTLFHAEDGAHRCSVHGPICGDDVGIRRCHSRVQ